MRYILILFILIFFSCNDDSIKSDNNYSDVVLNVNISQAFSGRAQTANETYVNDIMVLVFEGGEFQYYVSGISIQNNPANATMTFRARLVTTDNSQTLYLVANATSLVTNANILVGDTEDEVKTKITKAYTVAGESPYFPMFAQYTISNIPSSGAIVSGIRLVRSIARVDVDATEVSDIFELQTIQVFRATNNIQIIPNDLPGNYVVTTPSVQTGWTNTINTTQIATTNSTQSSQQIYIPEAVTVNSVDNFNEATCIVIGGYYDGSDNLSFYRIDFQSADDSYPFGQVLRNHCYTFSITGMEGEGWPDPGTAAESDPSNLEIIVQEWNDEGMTAYFDGTNHFVVSPSNLQLSYRANRTDVFNVDTNVDDYTIEWATGTNAGIASQTQITNEYFNVVISGDKQTISVATLQENTTTDNITFQIIVRAKRLVIPIRVTQLTRTINYNRAVSVLSFRDVGHLGSGSLDNVTFTGSTEGRPMRMILNNHFRPTGTVGINNILFTSLGPGTEINTQLTDAILYSQDIIYINNNIRPNTATAQRIIDWLDSKPTRVLILGYDWKDAGTGATRTAWEILQLLTDQITGYWYNGGNSQLGDTPGEVRTAFRIPFIINESTDYFFNSGPFTTPTEENPTWTPINECFSVISDQYWGRAQIHNPNIIPLVNFSNPLNPNDNNPKTGWTTDPTGDGRMVIGVDPVRRIVYLGDAQQFGYNDINTGQPLQLAARIPNETGDLTNDYSRIMANLWAWMIEEIILKNDN